jgi:hypothetical protein
MTPTFDWNDISGATSYTILVDNNSDFASPEINQSPTVSTYTPVTDLADGTYYWKVLSTNAFGSSSYSGTWSLILQAPQPNIALSVSSINTSAAPEATDTDSFDINNTGDASLTYNITKEYATKGAKADLTVNSNDFATGIAHYTTSGLLTWIGTAGTAKVTASTNNNQYKQGVLTSDTFDGTGCSALYLEFTQNFTTTDGDIKVEYLSGSTWTSVYTAASSTTNAQNIAIPTTATQIRFTANLYKNAGSWTIDNVVVSGPEAGPSFTWLTINSATSGTVTPSGSETIDITCDAAGLVAGTYNANITVTTNDPDEPNKVLPVTFTVEIPLTAPINVITSVDGTDLTVSWEAVYGATSYDIYSSTEPYGEFIFVTNVDTESYVTTADQSMLFWYIVAKN